MEMDLIITYQENTQLTQKELVSLYESVGWQSYTSQPEQLQKAIEQSFNVLTAWDHDRLIGLIRVISDGETILYIQDILVHPNYQKQTIGSSLMEQILKKYAHIRQKMLLTDDTSETRHFYEKFQFSTCEQNELVAFYRSF